jgi:ribonuclease VapC
MLARKGGEGVIALDALLSRLGLEVVTMSPVAADFAREAYSRYGKGVGSPEVLNYGDVLSYGVARAEDEPLLFKGEDFARTDITSAQQ